MITSKSTSPPRSLVAVPGAVDASYVEAPAEETVPALRSDAAVSAEERDRVQEERVGRRRDP